MIGVKKFFGILSLIIMLTMTSVCVNSKTIVATGADRTRTIAVRPFTELEVSSAIEVDFTVGRDISVSVTAPESILPYVEVKNDGKSLRCRINAGKDASLDLKGRELKISIIAPMVTDVEINGASSVKFLSPVSGVKKFDADLSGASRISITKMDVPQAYVEASGASNASIASIKTQNLEVEANGASTVKIAGKATTVDVDASGASSVDIKNLIVGGGSVEASGASSVSGHTSLKNCALDKSGASSINY